MAQKCRTPLRWNLLKLTTQGKENIFVIIDVYSLTVCK